MNAVDNVIQVQRDMEYDHPLWNTVNNEYMCIDWAVKALGLCLFRRIENDNRNDQWRISCRHISVDFIRLLPVKKRRSTYRIDYDAFGWDIRKDTKE